MLCFRLSESEKESIVFLNAWQAARKNKKDRQNLLCLRTLSVVSLMEQSLCSEKYFQLLLASLLSQSKVPRKEVSKEELRASEKACSVWSASQSKEQSI